MRNSGPRFAPSLMYIKCCNKSHKSDMNEKTSDNKASKHSHLEEACRKTYLLLHFRGGRVRFLHQICMGSCGRLTLSAECTAIVKVSLLLQHLSHTQWVSRWLVALSPTYRLAMSRSVNSAHDLGHTA